MASDLKVSPSVSQHVLEENSSSFVLGLKKEEQAIVDLPYAQGDLAQIAMTIEGGAFDIALQDGQGRHIRQFLDKGEGRKHVVFVTETDVSKLYVKANEDGRISISQIARIAKDAQIPPKPSLLSPRLNQLSEHLEQGGEIDSFWAEIAEKGTPLVEPAKDGQSIVTFLARGANENVRLLGGPTNDHYPLTRLGQSDVRFKSMRVPAGTLFSYQLARDVPDFEGPARLRRTAILAKAKADPYNKHPWPSDAEDGFNQQSTLRLSGGPLTIWHDERNHPQGTLTHHLLASPELGNKRDIWIYQSPGLDVSDPNVPLLFVFDGERFLSSGNAQRVLDNLVAEKKIPPLVAVFVSPIDLKIRAKELPNSDAFAAFMAKTLHPFVISKTGLKPKAERTILAGASFGGLGSTTIALKYPDLFGNALSMSGSYWWSPEGDEQGGNYVARLVAHAPKKPVRFFLAPGIFEAARGSGFAGIRLPNRHLKDVLAAKEYDVILQEYPSAHDMFAWREILPQGLIALIGK